MILREDWEYNVLEVYNYKKSGKFDGYFDFIKNNHDKLDGDLCEVGVYRGSSLIATSLLLKELGSDKKVFGFDSFSGFPSYHKYDSLSYFENLYQQGSISSDHYNQYLTNIRHKEVMNSVSLDSSNISSSKDFSETSISLLKKKIDYFELDNIEIVDGDYKHTMTKKTYNDTKFMSVLIDCDLYESYKTSLPFVWDRLIKGGYIYLDEYFSLKFPGARIATDSFFSNKKEKPEMYPRNSMDFERWFVNKSL